MTDTDADADAETVTFTIATDEEETTLTLPRALVDMVGEAGEGPTETVGDVAMMSLANRVHHMVHHHEDDADPELDRIETATMDLFERRFGVTFAEATGHDH